MLRLSLLVFVLITSSIPCSVEAQRYRRGRFLRINRVTPSYQTRNAPRQIQHYHRAPIRYSQPYPTMAHSGNFVPNYQPVATPPPIDQASAVIIPNPDFSYYAPAEYTGSVPQVYSDFDNTSVPFDTIQPVEIQTPVDSFIDSGNSLAPAGSHHSPTGFSADSVSVIETGSMMPTTDIVESGGIIVGETIPAQSVLLNSPLNEGILQSTSTAEFELEHASGEPTVVRTTTAATTNDSIEPIENQKATIVPTEPAPGSEPVPAVEDDFPNQAPATAPQDESSKKIKA